jgi:16S rRNA (uracil1498-N3)-methyltransferase
MSLLRAFHAGALSEPAGEVILDPAESRHLTRVRRARLGDRIQVLDGQGCIAIGLLVGNSPDAARLRYENLTRQPAPVPFVLAVGLPKAGLIEDIIREATELGATAVQPLLTARSETRLDDPARLAHKQARWQAAALEACKQSGNPWLPAVHPPQTVEAWLSSLHQPAAGLRKYVAALTPDAIPFHDLMAGSLTPASASTTGVVLAVGPEGDFTPAEYARLAAAGFQSIRLPGHVLRVETACAAGLALLRGEFAG